MRLHGSCRCKAVRFSLRSTTPYPYMRCYCSVCRKTAGGGGYAINIMGQAESLEVEGGEHIAIWRASADQTDEGGPGLSPARRHFCSRCASALWVSDPRWPELLHPFASAIDTALPKPPETVHIMLDFAAPWVEVPRGANHRHFRRYPDESIADWHKRHRLDGGKPAKAGRRRKKSKS